MYSEIGKRIAREASVIALLSTAIMMLALALHYIVVPKWNAVQEKKAQISHYKVYLSTQNGPALLRKEIEEKNVRLESVVSALSSGLDNSSISSILEILIAKASAADIRFVKIQPQTQAPGSRAYPVVLEMNTMYNSLGRLIASLETLPQLLRVERLAIETLPQGKISARCLVTCILSEKGALK